MLWILIGEAGLARARADGKQLGRRPVEQSQARKVKAALALLSQGIGIRRIAREVGLGVGTVLRIVKTRGLGERGAELRGAARRGHPHPPRSGALTEV
jgi:DNA invertase Pin-like site-specific DNA recombinase